MPRSIAPLLALLVLLPSACTAEVGEAVQPADPVVDDADLLSPAAEAQLNADLHQLFDRTGDALVVATVRSLEGREIEKVANDMFNTWGIGDAPSDRGLLLLVAPAERAVRIEVGCGLERTITDVIAGRIIRSDIVPRFQVGDMEGGVRAGTDAMMARLAARTPANDAPGCDGQARIAA